MSSSRALRAVLRPLDPGTVPASKRLLRPLFFTYFVVLPLLLKCGASPAESAPALDTNVATADAATLDTVVVTGTRSQVKLDDLPVSATVLTRKDIEASAAQSLDQLLLTVAGVNLNEPPSFAQHPTSNSISLRGLGGYRTLVLLDGVPINHAFSGFVQWNQVPLEAIERVEVIRGGASSLWGNYALTGLINIITRKPRETGASVTASYGGDDTSQLGAAGNWVVNDRVRLGLRVDRFDTDGYNTAPKDQRGPLFIPTSFQQNNVQGTALFNPTETLEGYVRGNWHENQQELDTALSDNDQHDAGVAAGLTRHLADAARIELNGWYEHSRFTTHNTATPEDGTFGEDEFVQNVHRTPVDDSGASLVWTQPLQGRLTEVQIGSDVRYIDGKDSANIYDEDGSYLRNDLGKGRQAFVGVFGQVGARPFPVPLDFTLSARYDYFRNFDGFDGNPGGTGDQPDRSRSSFDPRFALRYALTPAVALRGAAYRAFRAPNLDSLYRGFSTATGTFLPNSQLGPETLLGGEVGADWRRDAWSLGVTVFRQQIKNLIGSRNLTDAELPPGFFFGSRNINVGKVRSQGVEVIAEYAVLSTLRASLSYTYTDSRVRENDQDPGSVGKQTPNIPYNAGTVGATWSPIRALNLALETRWAGRSWGDSASTLEQEPHFVADVHGDYRLTPSVQVFAAVSNAFDREYVGTNSGFEAPKLGPPVQALGGVRVVW